MKKHFPSLRKIVTGVTGVTLCACAVTGVTAVTAVAFATGATTAAAASAARPKLVVEIVVDQLRTDYIEFLSESFGNRGFNRLKERGVYMQDVDFGVPGLDIVSATAMLQTGAWPSETGIASAQAFDSKTSKRIPALQDPASASYSTVSYTPANLLLSTVSDELGIDGNGLSAIHSIACDPQQAVILAGHTGTSAVWLNELNGQWTTSGYYGSLPQPASQRNLRQSLASRVDTMQWKPLLPLDRYAGLPQQKRQYAFRHTFPTADKDVYRRLIASPLGNREITNLAIDYLTQLKLGNRTDVMDMLAIGYTAAPYKYVKDGDYRIELQDSYLRLDSEIGRLLDAVEKNVGLDNALIILSSTGYYNDATPDDPKFRIPSGEFSTKRAFSLLNSFLSAKYGNGDYVAAFADGQIWLNRRNLENTGADLQEATNLAREFLCKMSGVRGVLTLQEVITGATPAASALAKRVVPANAADLFVDFTPGWNVIDDRIFPPVTTPVRTSMVNTPAFILAPGSAAIGAIGTIGGIGNIGKTITDRVDATALAPTITQLLRLRSPNGAISRPLRF